MARQETNLNWTRRSLVVRRRSLNETRDLTLRVIGKNLTSLLSFYVPLVVVFYLLDVVLWAFVLHYPRDYSNVINSAPIEVLNLPKDLLNFLIIWLTVSLETAFVGSLTTQYLGEWLFSVDGKVQVRKIWRLWCERWFQCVYYLVVTRIVRFRFFYPETILLERSPFFRSGARLSTTKRVKYINSGSTFGDFFGAFLGTEFFLLSGCVTGYYTAYPLIKSIVPDYIPRFFLLTFVILPIFVFGSKLYTVVFNFLQYVNYRTKNEGWDVDLAFKTELSKLSKELELEEGDGSRRASYDRYGDALVLDQDWLNESTQPVKTNESDVSSTQDGLRNVAEVTNEALTEERQ